jgi:hypothetical protein
MFRWSICLAGALALGVPLSAFAKPIAYAEGTTVMAEYGAGTMIEAQAFYAPRYDYSVGGGHLELASDEFTKVRLINYARLNYLAHRWNLTDAQANVFVWGGLGATTGNTFAGTLLAENAGAQVDYETRRVYMSVKSDLQRSKAFSHRIDTLQLGVAPYKHDYGSLATWLVVQGRQYTGGIHQGIDAALLLRLFKGGAWVEAGVTNDGKLQAMAMFNF